LEKSGEITLFWDRARRYDRGTFVDGMQRGTDQETSREPCWYITATWNLWTVDRIKFRAASRELAFIEANRLIAERSPDALERFGQPAITMHDSYLDDATEPYRQVREDFEPDPDPAVHEAYRAEIAAEAAELFERLRSGRGVLIGYTSRRSPIDYGLSFVDRGAVPPARRRGRRRALRRHRTRAAPRLTTACA
jgi:hypothetical protein